MTEPKNDQGVVPPCSNKSRTVQAEFEDFIHEIPSDQITNMPTEGWPLNCKIVGNANFELYHVRVTTNVPECHILAVRVPRTATDPRSMSHFQGAIVSKALVPVDENWDAEAVKQELLKNAFPTY